MRRKNVTPIRIIVPAAALAILLAACGSSGSTKTAATASTTPATTATTAAAFTVGTATDPKLGVVLVDAQGRTLYHNTKENGGTIACTGGCVGVWPVLSVPAGSTPAAAPGLPGKLATITRADGPTQVTYNGQPLYRYSGDKWQVTVASDQSKQVAEYWQKLISGKLVRTDLANGSTQMYAAYQKDQIATYVGAAARAHAGARNDSGTDETDPHHHVHDARLLTDFVKLSPLSCRPWAQWGTWHCVPPTNRRNGPANRSGGPSCASGSGGRPLLPRARSCSCSRAAGTGARPRWGCCGPCSRRTLRPTWWWARLSAR